MRREKDSESEGGGGGGKKREIHIIQISSWTGSDDIIIDPSSPPPRCLEATERMIMLSLSANQTNLQFLPAAVTHTTNRTATGVQHRSNNA